MRKIEKRKIHDFIKEFLASFVLHEALSELNHYIFLVTSHEIINDIYFCIYEKALRNNGVLKYYSGLWDSLDFLCRNKDTELIVWEKNQCKTLYNTIA